ncbi:MAG: hypothetical protein JXR76_15475 [Deltaproteobacteria bacterium]|nr:hypothetical protein [Deltaproteobacteria bacterium]
MKLLTIWAVLLLSTTAQTTWAGDIYADGRDHWSLMDKSPINRQLHEQLQDSSQRTRLWQRPDSRFAFMVDASTGGQQSLPETNYDQTRYHGFFIFDSYGAVRLFDALDVNLNLNFLNPSFCDGYRKSFQLVAGMSIHYHHELFAMAGDLLVFNALLMDLDTVTFGEGLLIEQVPLEGFSFSLKWKEMSLSAHIAARVFWHYDDLLMMPLSLFNGRIKLLGAIWYFTEPLPETDGDALDIFRTSNKIQSYFPFVGISAQYDWKKQFRVSAEYLARIKSQHVSNAVLLRADLMYNSKSRFNLHLGYQFRFYQKEFAPLDSLSSATTAPQIPQRENTYVTNSFEYMSLSPWYNQLSHTAMTEVQLNVTSRVQLYYELECWFRWVFNNSADERVLYLNKRRRAPGVWKDIFFDVGLRYRLSRGLPHRVSVFVSNKWVASDVEATTPMQVRFVTEPLYGFELEVFL